MEARYEIVQGFVPPSRSAVKASLTRDYTLTLAEVLREHLRASDSIFELTILKTDELALWDIADLITEWGLIDPLHDQSVEWDSHDITCYFDAKMNLKITTKCPAKFYCQKRHNRNILSNLDKLLGGESEV